MSNFDFTGPIINPLSFVSFRPTSAARIAARSTILYRRHFASVFNWMGFGDGRG